MRQENPRVSLLEEKLKYIRGEKLAAAEAVRSYRDSNKIEFFGRGLELNPKQSSLIQAILDPRFKVFTFTGGNRSGKTTVWVLIALSVMAGYFLWDEQKKPIFKTPSKIRVVGQDWEKHIKTVVVPTLKEWMPANRKFLAKKNSLGVEALFTDAKTGSTLEIMSNLQDPEVHEGWQGDWVMYDEPPKRAIRVANARGLVDRLGRELFCMTLLKEAWVDREVIKAMTEDGRPDLSVYNVHATIYDNVGYGITDEGIEQFAKTLTEDEKRARLEGKPSYLSGLVLGDFKRDTHIVEPFRIPSDWLVDIAIDVHPRKEQAILFVATDPRQYRYAFHEIWANMNPEEIADSIYKVVKQKVLRVNEIIIDPLSKGDKNMGDTTFDRIAAVLARYNLPLIAASKDKDSGIIKIKEHLKGQNKMPSLFFFSDMRRTIYEAEGWMWDKESQKAQKVDDDMMENLYRILLLDTRYRDKKSQKIKKRNWKVI